MSRQMRALLPSLLKNPKGKETSKEREKATSREQRSAEIENKQYYLSLETTNRQLHLEIDVLKKENQKLREIVSLHARETTNFDPLCIQKQLKVHENFFLNDLQGIIEETKDANWCSMVKNMERIIGSFGNQRVLFIKSSFQNIVDSLIPVQTKTYVALFRKFTNKKLISLVKAKEISEKNKYKKWISQNSENLESLLRNYQFSDEFTEYLVDVAPEYKKKLENLKKLVKTLVTLQNNLLTQMNDLANVSFIPATAKFKDFITL
jgi:hypothetical protein